MLTTFPTSTAIRDAGPDVKWAQTGPRVEVASAEAVSLIPV